MLSSPYAGTRPCRPKVFLLLRALASPSTSAVVCACMAQRPWIVAQLPLLVATLCFNPALGPRMASRSAECRAAELPCGAGSTHTWRATERRLHFDSPTRTRVNSDSSVNDGYCFRLFSVDTSPSTYFSPFPSRTLPRSTRTKTDSGQLRSSISLLGNHAEFLLSRSTSALNTLQASVALCISDLPGAVLTCVQHDPWGVRGTSSGKSFPFYVAKTAIFKVWHQIFTQRKRPKLSTCVQIDELASQDAKKPSIGKTLVYSSRREGNINKQTKLKSFLTHDRRSVSPHRPACVRGDHWAIWLACREFLSNRKCPYRPYTQPDVGNCWPCDV